MKEIFPGIFSMNDKLATLNSIEGFNPFNEELIKSKDKEYRIWDPNRSKLAAAIKKNIKNVPLEKNMKILYLGIAHGFTATFLSNIIGNGIIYGLEFSERCFNELLPLCEKYKNIVPILADARKPEEYKLIEKVDIVYCDLAQPDQTEIAIRNCKFLKPNGYLFLAIKTRSIDVTKSPKDIVKQEIEKLKDFKLLDWKMLDPFEKDHGFVIVQKK
jgi:fibrillarin-like pre-rRNA processing protein